MIRMSWTRLLIINIIILLSFQSLIVNGQVEFAVAPSNITVNETDGASFVLLLSSEDLMMSNDDIITINIITSGGALNGTDYLIPSSLTINTTDPTVTVFNITVSIINDNITEYDESAVIMFESPNVTFTPSNVSFTILENDAIAVFINNTDMTLNEGDEIILCASTDGPHSTSFNVTATASSTDDINPSTDILLFEPGDTMKCTSFMIIDNDMPEGEESVTIGWSLSPATPNVILMDPITSTITIPSQLIVSVLNDSMISVAEGSVVKICLMMNGMSGVIGVNVSYFIFGDADDYSGLASSGNIIITTDLSCITINITNDSVIENNESISVQFQSVTGATLSSTNNTIEINIMDNTAVSVSIDSSVTVYDNSSSVELCATLSNDNITFNGVSPTLSATPGGNATLDVDYSFASMDIIPNVPGCGSVLILNNGTVRGNRLLTINWTIMASPQISGDRISLDTALTDINIIDTDYATIGFADTSITVPESVGSVSVFLSNISGEISVPFNVSITAERPHRQEGLFIFSDNYNDFSWSLSRQPIVVNINDNNIINEGNRTLTLSLKIVDSNNLNINIQNGRITITVTEDDFPSPSSTSMPVPTSTETPSESSAPTGFFNTITIVGIIVGVVVLGLLLLLLLVCVIACIKVRSNRQGFYATQEDKEEAPQMLRYSASLRSLQSQTVMPVDSRDKENEYLV
ncbi:PREDICTED: uncharacterized protein LOC109588869 [Amphimedon queenslandica]|uniref:Calx-beta domain-containing protein n=1 Tax=Amphimedon queenslandica TaxID=400682 RepID=A0A1X7TAR8_AMPQE|nr:PREDICTED: uncharacterized protein LOC109588869 [Amphimedon queenslandica]|eukprot:XP_019860532.1 PREDICTED: uncharacterized protein LOC109588869 [Amphimedon queenslandica]